MKIKMFAKEYSPKIQKLAVLSNAKGISSIRSPSPEKMSSIWLDLAVLDKCQNIPIFVHVLDVFSGLGYRVKLFPFPLGQAS